MKLLKTVAVALIALSIMAPASTVFAQETAPEEGRWYTAEDAPQVAPKPACPRKPNRRENFVAMWKWEGGQYTECRWDSQGARPAAATTYSGWGWLQCDAQRLVSPAECRLGVLNNRGITPTQYFSGGFVPNYQGFQSGYNGNGYQQQPAQPAPGIYTRNGRQCQVPYQCPNSGHYLCYIPSC